MGVQRLNDIPSFNIDRVAAAAGDDPDVLRLENLDTDIPPPAEATDAAAVDTDDADSWLSFTGRGSLHGGSRHALRTIGDVNPTPNRSGSSEDRNT